MPKNDISEALKFLRNLWGLLSGSSVLFPMSSQLFGLMPIYRGEINNLIAESGIFVIPPGLVTTLATVTTLLVLLATVNNRSKLKYGEFDRGSTKQRTRNKSFFAFFISLVSLVFYLYLFFAPLALDNTPSRYIRLILLLRDLVLAGFFSCFFALLTRSFALIGLDEYMNEGD